MQIKVVGTRKLDFVNNGQAVKGTQIFALYKDNSPFVIGESVLLRKTKDNAFKLPFVAESVASDIPLGIYEIEADYVTGNICSIKMVK